MTLSTKKVKSGKKSMAPAPFNPTQSNDSPAVSKAKRDSPALPSINGRKYTKRRKVDQSDRMPVSSMAEPGPDTCGQAVDLDRLANCLGQLYRVTKSEGHPDRLFDLATKLVLQITQKTPRFWKQTISKKVYRVRKMSPVVCLAIHAFYTTAEIDKTERLREDLQSGKAALRSWPLSSWTEEDETRWGNIETTHDIDNSDDEIPGSTSFQSQAAKSSHNKGRHAVQAPTHGIEPPNLHAPGNFKGETPNPIHSDTTWDCINCESPSPKPQGRREPSILVSYDQPISQPTTRPEVPNTLSPPVDTPQKATQKTYQDNQQAVPGSHADSNSSTPASEKLANLEMNHETTSAIASSETSQERILRATGYHQNNNGHDQDHHANGQGAFHYYNGGEAHRAPHHGDRPDRHPSFYQNHHYPPAPPHWFPHPGSNTGQPPAWYGPPSCGHYVPPASHALPPYGNPWSLPARPYDEHNHAEPNSHYRPHTQYPFVPLSGSNDQNSHLELRPDFQSSMEIQDSAPVDGYNGRQLQILAVYLGYGYSLDDTDEKFDAVYWCLSSVGPITFESSQQNRKYGITAEWLQNAKKQWLQFDWRKAERRINSFPNFTSHIHELGTDFKIHFVGLFSEHMDAVPVLMLHGWPGSFLEFLPILNDLKTRYTPATLPYHIVVPSLPGYAFSSTPPIDRDFRLEDAARILDTLMVGLGFGDGYVVQGGDVGSKVARVLGATSPTVRAVHLNFCIMPDPGNISETEYNDLEKKGLERASWFSRLGSAYALEHATKPATIGLTLSASPLAMLAWVGEKFLDWTDEDPSLEIILESVTLYWLSGCFSTSLWPYRRKD
ncbi:putative Epoxide hydrolase N-terminal domain-containing protein [Seiridium cardinale]